MHHAIRARGGDRPCHCLVQWQAARSCVRPPSEREPETLDKEVRAYRSRRHLVFGERRRLDEGQHVFSLYADLSETGKGHDIERAHHLFGCCSFNARIPKSSADELGAYALVGDPDNLLSRQLAVSQETAADAESRDVSAKLRLERVDVTLMTHLHPAGRRRPRSPQWLPSHPEVMVGSPWTAEVPLMLVVLRRLSICAEKFHGNLGRTPGW